MEHIAYMRLPNDADGVPCKPGDMLAWDGGTHEVMAVSDGCVWFDTDPRECKLTPCEANGCRHVEPDPLKELLRTFYLNARDVCDANTGDLDEECEAWAERIRELMEVDR